MFQYLYIAALSAFGLGTILWIPYRVMRRGRIETLIEGQAICPGFRPADGLAYFCANMIVYLLTAPYLQVNLWGLLATELLLLFPALAMPFLTGMPPRQFFRFRFPSARHTAGGILLWMGAILGVSLGTSLLLMIFPQIAEETESINSFMNSGSLTTRLICVVLAPAICEELFHRGVILASFRGRYNDAFIVVVMGLVFGVFHMDPARFHSTALLGMALTYAALRSRSILLPILMHCINNLFSVGIGFLEQTSETIREAGGVELSEASESLLVLTGQGLFAILSLLLLSAGYLLLRDDKRPVKGRKNPIVICAASMAVVLAIQAVLTVGRWAV